LKLIRKKDEEIQESTKLDEEEKNVNILVCEKSEFFDSDVSEEEFYLKIHPMMNPVQEIEMTEEKETKKRKKSNLPKRKKFISSDDEDDGEDYPVKKKSKK
jgi:hypothetical protein